MSPKNFATLPMVGALAALVALAPACASELEPDAGQEDPAENIGRVQQPLTGALAYRGVNLCGAEFAVDHWGNGALPGVFGRDYTYPDVAYNSSYASLDYYMAKGMTTFRLPFRWERLQPTRNQAFDAAELSRLKTTVGRILGKGGAVVLDPQNFARYGTATIGSSSVPNGDFADFWRRLAVEFKTNPNVLFGLVNEPHDIATEQWVAAANAAIAGIRQTGATNLILVPGNAWTGAHAWSGTWYGTPNSRAMLNIVDPGNNYAFEVHQYLDADSGGGGSQCVSATIGSERMAGFTSWLRANGKRGFLGEFGGPATTTCAAAMDDILKHLEANADVYVGWTAWAGGPWWSNYALSMEPTSSTDRMQMNAIEPHLAWSGTSPSPLPLPPPPPPPSGTCSPATYEAEAMTKSTGGATSGGWNLWSNGAVTTTRQFAAGPTTITVHAAGQAAGGVWPRMVVSVGGSVIGTTNVTSTAYAPHSFTFDATDGAKEIRVAFDNDAVIGTEDRNLLVDKVEVGCPIAGEPPPPPPEPTCTDQTFEAEAMTKSTGGAMTGGWNLFSNGYLSTNATFSGGPTTIVVSAGGVVVQRQYAHFYVTVGGTRIGDAYVTSSSFRDYSFPYASTAGAKEIRVTYDNDVSNKRGDRNLYLDKVSVRCP